MNAIERKQQSGRVNKKVTKEFDEVRVKVSNIIKSIDSSAKFKITNDENIFIVEFIVKDIRPNGIAFKVDGALSQEFDKQVNRIKDLLKKVGDKVNRMGVQDIWISDLSLGFVV